MEGIGKFLKLLDHKFIQWVQDIDANGSSGAIWVETEGKGQKGSRF